DGVSGRSGRRDGIILLVSGARKLGGGGDAVGKDFAGKRGGALAKREVAEAKREVALRGFDIERGVAGDAAELCDDTIADHLSCRVRAANPHVAGGALP